MSAYTFHTDSAEHRADVTRDSDAFDSYLAAIISTTAHDLAWRNLWHDWDFAVARVIDATYPAELVALAQDAADALQGDPRRAKRLGLEVQAGRDAWCAIVRDEIAAMADDMTDCIYAALSAPRERI